MSNLDVCSFISEVKAWNKLISKPLLSLTPLCVKGPQWSASSGQVWAVADSTDLWQSDLRNFVDLVLQGSHHGLVPSNKLPVGHPQASSENHSISAEVHRFMKLILSMIFTKLDKN